MKNNKLGSGNRETGSLAFFDHPELSGRFNNLQREKKDMAIDEIQEFRDKCKMGFAERWNVVAKRLIISTESKRVISDYLARDYPNAQRTVSCILDYFSGRRQVNIHLDVKKIPVKHRAEAKRINLAYRDCEQLKEKYVKKISEKLSRRCWDNISEEDRLFYQEQFRALQVAMDFTNFYLRKLISDSVSKDNISETQFQAACELDNRMQDWYQKNEDGNYSLVNRDMPPSYQAMNQACATFFICKEYEKH